MPNISLNWQLWSFWPNLPKKRISSQKWKNCICACVRPMVVTYYIKLFRLGANRYNGIFMPLLLLVAETVNVWMVNCLVFAICYFRLHRKWCLQNFCLIKKRIVLEIVDKNAFDIMTLPNNLVLICRLSDHNLVFWWLYMIREIWLLLKYE